MRAKSRIKPFLKWIEEEWNKSYDQRFGQLLINLGLVEDSQLTWNLDTSDYIKGGIVPFKYLREIEIWGIYNGTVLREVDFGKEKRLYHFDDYTFRPISELDTNHIHNILRTQYQISDYLKAILIQELEWRLSCDEQGFEY